MQNSGMELSLFSRDVIAMGTSSRCRDYLTPRCWRDRSSARRTAKTSFVPAKLCRLVSPAC
jgi:hypothetical protein